MDNQDKSMSYQDQLEEIENALECVSEGSIGEYALLQAKEELQELIDYEKPREKPKPVTKPLEITGTVIRPSFTIYDDDMTPEEIEFRNQYKWYCDELEGVAEPLSFEQWFKRMYNSKQPKTTVKDVIERLKQFDENMEVVMPHEGLTLDSTERGYNDLFVEFIDVITISDRIKEYRKESNYVLARDGDENARQVLVIC